MQRPREPRLAGRGKDPFWLEVRLRVGGWRNRNPSRGRTGERRSARTAGQTGGRVAAWVRTMKVEASGE